MHRLIDCEIVVQELYFRAFFDIIFYINCDFCSEENILKIIHGQ